MRYVAYIFGALMWVGGVVLAKGVGSTAAALLIPFWAWYLVVEKVMITNGWM